MKKKASILFVFLYTSLFCYGIKIEKSFDALNIYDYFKAKQIAHKCAKKNKSLSSFVLASIYYRSDNPFHNYDSAYKYIEIAFTHFNATKDLKVLRKYSYNDSSIVNLRKSIHKDSYWFHINSKKEITISELEQFINFYQYSAHLNSAIYKRDSIVFYTLLQEKKSDKMKEFILSYPESLFIEEAYKQQEFFIYKEYTQSKQQSQIEKYIQLFPSSKYVINAQDELFEIATKAKNKALMYKYIKQFPANSHVETCWKSLYSLEIINYSNDALTSFLRKYPDFPFKQSIEKEISLSKTILLLVKLKEKYGFINDIGDTIIKMQFDGLEEFHEGIAIAEKDGKFGYINKSGETVIDFELEDAENFKNGRAIVKYNSLYYVIDRAGNKVSDAYEGISDFSEGLAIVKKNNLYGAIDKNGKLEIPMQYQQMGEFNLGLSFAKKNGQYGYVDSKGLPQIPFIFEWAEKFIDGRARVKYNNKYGIINFKGEYIIKPVYDRIDEEINSIYVVYKNNSYGFIENSGCMLSDLTNLPINNTKALELTNGVLMRTSAEDEQNLIDKNGKRLTEKEVYEEMYLPHDGLIRVSQNEKYGFVNANNKTIIKPTYEDASDFGDSICVAEKKETKFILNTKGEILFSIKTKEFEKINSNYFYYRNEKNELIICNKTGKSILTTTKELPDLLLDRFLIWEEKNKTTVYDLLKEKFIF